MVLKLYNPEVFQGNLKLKNYFEGWYFKHVSFNLDSVYSFIPGVSLSESDPHCFIQVLNGINGKSSYIQYSLDEFSWDKNRMYIKVGDSVFSENYISLNIKDKEIEAEGLLTYSNRVSYPSNLFSPGIMGWYSFVPLMECKHGIVSVNHDISGSLNINDYLIDFSKGKGYIEKDWGRSFPEAWIWIQSNNFIEPGTAFTFSIAKIPWMGRHFIGLISFVYVHGRFYLFSTYNNSSITEISRHEGGIGITLKNKNNKLKIDVKNNGGGELRAPVSGQMSRRIKESIDSVVYLELFDNKNNLIYKDKGERAGLEIIDEIFEYL